MPRKIKPKPLRGRDVAALLSSLDDYRAVIAAGKVQRWDVVKWAVTLNLAFATVSVIWDQKTPGLFAPRTILFALASAVMVAAVALHILFAVKGQWSYFVLAVISSGSLAMLLATRPALSIASTLAASASAGVSRA